MGLILPGLLRIHRELTPLAAVGLVIVMTGATVISALAAGVTAAIMPFVTRLLAAWVEYGRSSWVRAIGHVQFQSTSA